MRRGRLGELLLLSASGGSFALFLACSVFFKELVYLSPPVGILEQGEANIKTPGTNEFVPARPRLELRDLDAVWAGTGQTAMVQLMDGSRLKLEERTLAVFKAPFSRYRLGIRRKAPAKFELITGDIDFQPVSLPVRLLSKRIESVAQVEPASSSAPSPTPSPLPSPSFAPILAGVFPEDGATLVMTTPVGHDVVFSWGAPVQGRLWVALAGARAPGATRELHGERSTKIHVAAVPGAYEWRVEAPGKVIGPFKYRVIRVNPKDLGKLISREANPDAFVIF